MMEGIRGKWKDGRCLISTWSKGGKLEKASSAKDSVKRDL